VKSGTADGGQRLQSRISESHDKMRGKRREVPAELCAKPTLVQLHESESSGSHPISSPRFHSTPQKASRTGQFGTSATTLVNDSPVLDLEARAAPPAKKAKEASCEYSFRQLTSLFIDARPKSVTHAWNLLFPSKCIPTSDSATWLQFKTDYTHVREVCRRFAYVLCEGPREIGRQDLSEETRQWLARFVAL
jgi:hypothetical protein